MTTDSRALEQANLAGAAQGTGKSNQGLQVGLALATLYIIWGSTYFAISFAVQTIPPFLQAGIRFFLAGTIMFAFLRWRGEPMPTLKEWRGAFIVGALLLLGGNGLVSVSEQYVASGLAALGVATTPIWAALFAGFFGKWPVKWEWVGLAVGFVGVILLNLEGDMRANPLAAGLLIVAAMSWAFGTVISTRLVMPHGFMATATQMLTAGIAMVGVGFVTGERFTQVPSTSSLLALLYLIFVGAIVAYSAYGFLLRTVRPTLATSYAYVNPAVAVALGVGLKGEHITWLGVLAMAVIISSVGVLALARSKTKVPAKA